MSHFTVLVVGEDVDGQLAPYHEFECTGRDDQYVQDVDITDEVRVQIDQEAKDAATCNALQAALEYYGLENNVVTGEDEVKRGDIHKYGYAVVKDGTLIKAVKRTNPNKHWDWYVVGGRWGGFFRLKPNAVGVIGDMGTYDKLYGDRRDHSKVDRARKGDIDIDGMRLEAMVKAARQYDTVLRILGTMEPLAYTWQDVLDGKALAGLELDMQREKYWQQAPLVRLTELKKQEGWSAEEKELLICMDYEDYCVTRETFIEQARLAAVMTFAVVKDGRWYERGSMGWFGVVSDETADWPRQYTALLDSVSDETFLTVVDCHI